MKKSTTIYLSIASVFAFFLLVGCQKEDANGLDRREQKTVGTWKFEKAKLNTGIFSSEDVIHEFDEDELVINNDFTATYFDAETNSRMSGTWNIRVETSSDYSDEDCPKYEKEITLRLSMTDDQGIIHDLSLDNYSVNNKRIKGSRYSNKGSYKFELIKK